MHLFVRTVTRMSGAVSGSWVPVFSTPRPPAKAITARFFMIKFLNTLKQKYLKFGVARACSVKANFSLEQAMKAQKGSRGIVLVFL
jgi:hypothetical protein